MHSTACSRPCDGQPGKPWCNDKKNEMDVIAATLDYRPPLNEGNILSIENQSRLLDQRELGPVQLLPVSITTPDLAIHPNTTKV